jgi:hypothetical protein
MFRIVFVTVFLNVSDVFDGFQTVKSVSPFEFCMNLWEIPFKCISLYNAYVGENLMGIPVLKIPFEIIRRYYMLCKDKVVPVLK